MSNLASDEIKFLQPRELDDLYKTHRMDKSDGDVWTRGTEDSGLAVPPTTNRVYVA